VWLVLTGCSNPAENKPAAAVREPSRSLLPLPAVGERFVFDAASSKIGFTGSNVTRSHDGGFRAFRGEIVLVGGDPTASRVAVEIDTTSLWADNRRLAAHLKSPDFFDVARYPEARFESASITRLEDAYEVKGQIELHGVRKEIAFPASIEVGADDVRARAEFVIRRMDFGIEYPGLPDDLIRDEVVVRLELRATTAQGAHSTTHSASRSASSISITPSKPWARTTSSSRARGLREPHRGVNSVVGARPPQGDLPSCAGLFVRFFFMTVVSFLCQAQ
jgi:polyisoprenoid-binding protein YceI